MKYYYNRETEKLEETDNRSGHPLPPKTDSLEVAEEIYDRVGERFPIDWDMGYKGEPEIEITDDISKSDVESVLNNLKAEGLL